VGNKKVMSKIKLTLEQEAKVLAYLEYHHGKQMKGETRTFMYDIYRWFKGDRDASVCSCLDRDTFKKVEGFINTIDWSEETRSTEKMKQLLPNLYLEPIQIEEESTQPVEVDMAKLEKAIKKRQRKTKE
jgi:hypothetical protein